MRMRSAFCFLLMMFAIRAVHAQEPEPKRCSEGPTRALRIEQPGGWNLRFIKKLRPIATGTFKQPNLNVDFTFTTYKVRSHIIPLPEVTLQVCERLAALETLYFAPDHAMSLTKDGHVFAYLMSGVLKRGAGRQAGGVGATMNVVFYDLHGTGKFDGLQTMAPAGLPFVPQWVK